jgi:hypothetical protein
MTCEMFIDGIIQNFGDAMMQSAFVGASDIHARLFSNRFETLQLAQLRGVVTLRLDGFFRFFSGFQDVFFRHKNGTEQTSRPSGFMVLKIVEN